MRICITVKDWDYNVFVSPFRGRHTPKLSKMKKYFFDKTQTVLSIAMLLALAGAIYQFVMILIEP